ncbi:MAG: YibE/F family protein [Oscillospiraceae bacterium]|nr:YibE/F family protein [Oscillospiraceae bacterium]
MKAFINNNKRTIAVLLAAVVIFVAARIWVSPASGEDTGTQPEEYAEYDTGTVLEILSDSTEADDAADGAYRGDQLMLVEITSGRYEGETMQVYNYVGPLYGAPLKVGDSAVLIVSTYADGSHTATVYEFNRLLALAAIIALFVIATVLVGGKTGAKSLISLVITLICIFLILLPMLMKGFPTLLTVFLICAYVAVVSFTILGGVSRKTLCASLATICGIAVALLFGLAAQALARIDGLRLADVEPLLQLRQTGTPIGLRYLLVGGIVISALGAVMDVAMSIASAISEIHSVNPTLSTKELFRSGMNIGRDMVGTMTNTLILAFLGSSFVIVIYLYSIGLQPYQLLSSSYFAIEVISGISSSIGVIISVPLTALISAYVHGWQKAIKKIR